MVMLMLLCLALAGAVDLATRADAAPQPAYTWENGPPSDPEFFPIGVWLQDPARAPEYRDLGVNLYLGLWRGPTHEQLDALRAADMRVICDQNDTALARLDDPTIIGWLQPDEPDNCQPDGQGGWGPPTPPAHIVADYHRMRERDPSRPVLLNLGQGVANDEWAGTWRRLSDYPEYLRGCDIASFDIYPVAGLDRPHSEEWLWYVAKGVERLRRWGGPHKIVWNIIECTHIGSPDRKATPDQVKAMAWMSLIHGSQGIIYFVHQFQPTFIEAALLADPEMSAAVRDINHQIHQLAPVLNSPTVPDGATATSSDPYIPIATMTKRHGDDTYVFAVAMRNRPARATLTVDSLRGTEGAATVTVLGEDRTLQAWGGRFEDDFPAYGVRLYRVTPPRTSP